ncbi:MAG: lipopolysaccharide heptosyltransferase family protein, partial [Proteobacteria bacterium]|nr:lipopolysaccharide heptosyltransferase family protein [Pseudomonadota bacterium]
ALLSQSSLNPLISSLLEEYKVRSVSFDEHWWLENWDVFLSLYSDWPIALRAFLQGIPVRVGQFSKLWSFVFFNRGLRQKRSAADRSEGVYSLELAQKVCQELGNQKTLNPLPILFPENKTASEEAKRFLRQLGVDEETAFLVVHPGMAGSALNISAQDYSEVIRKLSKKIMVLVSEGPLPNDKMIVEAIEKEVPELRKVKGLSLMVLQEVFRRSRGVIAPSTGPLHLAHLVGVPTIGIYSPVRSHHPRRWAPQGGLVEPRIIFPEVACPAKNQCLGSSCPLFDCMKKVDWAGLILEAVDGLKVNV